jgi:hypothetical protein
MTGIVDHNDEVDDVLLVGLFLPEFGVRVRRLFHLLRDFLIRVSLRRF